MVHKSRKGASSSVTSIGTEENSLRVPKVQSRALIYMAQDKYKQRGENIDIKRHVSAE